MFNFKNCARIVAIHKNTGYQYVIGTTKVLNAYGDRISEYTYYTFYLDDVRISHTTGKPTFTVIRCGEIIGDQDSMDLIFEEEYENPYL